MYKNLIYSIVLLNILLVSCEDVYRADLDSRENLIVVESRIIVGENDNYVKLTETKGFNEREFFNAIKYASVKIINSNNEAFELYEADSGIFKLYFPIDPNLQYKIQIKYQEDTFESDFEKVPEEPYIDSIYGKLEVKTIEVDGENNVNNFNSAVGFQSYTDINGADSPYYFFTSRKILQYIYYKKEEGKPDSTFIGWDTEYPSGVYNIAGPPEKSDSNNIIKHPLFFFESTPQLQPGHVFYGWIFILYQYGITKSAYNYYADLNKQLGSDGKLFDPMFVQARNNLKCITDPKKAIMGNFEILSAKEYRYFIIDYKSPSDKLKKIPYYYDIPERGEILYIPERGEILYFPDFWETPHKIYPNEN